MKKIKLLQTYRGIAAILILFFHITLLFKEKLNHDFILSVFKEGFVGVDFFFVLSGFIIFYAHHRDFQKKEKIKSFFLKRFIRIYPTYWIAVILIATIYVIVGKNIVYRFHMTPWFIVKTVSLYPQWPIIINAAWSLSFEVFFYIIFGFGLLFLSYRYMIFLFSAYGLIILFNHFFMEYLFHIPPLKYFILDYFILEFVFGMVCAAIYVKYRFVSLKKTIFYIGVSLLMLIVSWFAYYCFDMFGIKVEQKFRSFTFGMPFAILVLGSVWFETRRNIKFLPWMTLIGEGSYSIYLLHVFVLTVCVILLRDFFKITDQTLIFFASIPVSIFALILPLLFHLFIEKPLLVTVRKLLLKR